ncbi:hypothetical protein DICVIV_08612 [Dictyocaulus viviparus]|uniref:Uncharacterized protein n=1 Tax=Dictyocaulus viviparus TaxID=29172 RepID=A0A0D8XSJ0_DICVI|nr:hypothetical protein DICVIV_08612 [Dictyocaulus viviparus]
MFSKTELKLKSPRCRRGGEEVGDDKANKEQTDPWRTVNDMDGENVNPLFTERWQMYSDCDMSTVVRSCGDGKEMLQYRGKWADGNWCSSESSGSSHIDEQEVICLDLKLEVATGSFGPVSTQSVLRQKHRALLMVLITKGASRELCGFGQFAQSLKSMKQDFKHVKQDRYCWYCYEVYTAMCLSQGKSPPSIHTRGIWRGHCMRDKNVCNSYTIVVLFLFEKLLIILLTVVFCTRGHLYLSYVWNTLVPYTLYTTLVFLHFDNIIVFLARVWYYMISAAHICGSQDVPTAELLLEVLIVPHFVPWSSFPTSAFTKSDVDVLCNLLITICRCISLFVVLF